MAPFRPSNSKETENEPLLERLGHIPEVVFIPEAWSPEEIRDWPSMTIFSQWTRVGLRSGWLDDHVPVLPFGIILPGDQNRSLPTPAQVDITVSSGKQIQIRLCNGEETPENVPNQLQRLEEQYWDANHVVFVGKMLDDMVRAGP